MQTRAFTEIEFSDSIQKQERRTSPRYAAGFVIWVTRPDMGRNSAWMLNVSAGGAAFRTLPQHAPQPGESIELATMPDDSEMDYAELPRIARYARVLRVEDAAATCRVAVRYEARVDASAQPPAAEKLVAAATAPAISLGGPWRAAPERTAV